LEGELLSGALESLQIVEEFSKSMQTTGVPLRVIWIAGSFDGIATASAKEFLSMELRSLAKPVLALMQSVGIWR